MNHYQASTLQQRVIFVQGIDRAIAKLNSPRSMTIPFGGNKFCPEGVCYVSIKTKRL